MQEVDDIHSQIEQCIRKTEVSLLRLLRQVSVWKTFIVTEMSDGMVFNSQSKAKAVVFRAVPFSKVCKLTDTQSKTVAFSDTSLASVIVISSYKIPAARILPYKPQW